MEPRRKYSVYIVHPETGKLVTRDRWAQEEDPSTAQCVAIVSQENYCGLVISKNILRNPDDKKGMYKWDAGKDAIRRFAVKVPNDLAFRNPSVKDTYAIYDARFQGLDEAIALIGGEPLVGEGYWTNDSDPDPNEKDYYGYGYYSWETALVLKTCKTHIRPVADLRIRGKSIAPPVERFAVYVVDPSDGALVPLSDWKNVEDPTAATVVAVINEVTRSGLLVFKEILDNPADPEYGWYDFDEAQAGAAAFRDPSCEGVTFRNPTKEEAFDLVSARFKGLDEALALVDGAPMEPFTCWTCEEDPDPESGGEFGFFYGGNIGGVGANKKTSTLCIRPVAQIKIE